MMTQRDIENSKREACERAKAEGMAEGRAEGATAASREMARKMKTDGVDLTKIAQYSGLSVEEISTL